MGENSIRSRLALVFSIVGIILLFFVFNQLSSSTSEIAVIISTALVFIISVYYTSDTIGLLYKFYCVKPPITRWIPVINEFYAIDSKFRPVSFVTLVIGLILCVIMVLPYSIKSMLGSRLALNLTNYCFIGALVVFSINQIIVGIGLFLAIRDISKEWVNIMHTDLGVIRLLSVVAFIPIVRVIAFYTLRKPLDTMVAFNDIDINTTADVEIEED